MPNLINWRVRPSHFLADSAACPIAKRPGTRPRRTRFGRRRRAPRTKGQAVARASWLLSGTARSEMVSIEYRSRSRCTSRLSRNSPWYDAREATRCGTLWREPVMAPRVDRGTKERKPFRARGGDVVRSSVSHPSHNHSTCVSADTPLWRWPRYMTRRISSQLSRPRRNGCLCSVIMLPDRPPARRTVLLGMDILENCRYGLHQTANSH
jgi:hypothetical protein